MSATAETTSKILLSAHSSPSVPHTESRRLKNGGPVANSYVKSRATEASVKKLETPQSLLKSSPADPLLDVASPITTRMISFPFDKLLVKLPPPRLRCDGMGREELKLADGDCSPRDAHTSHGAQVDLALPFGIHDLRLPFLPPGWRKFLSFTLTDLVEDPLPQLRSMIEARRSRIPIATTYLSKAECAVEANYSYTPAFDSFQPNCDQLFNKQCKLDLTRSILEKHTLALDKLTQDLKHLEHNIRVIYKVIGKGVREIKNQVKEAKRKRMFEAETDTSSKEQVGKNCQLHDCEELFESKQLVETRHVDKLGEVKEVLDEDALQELIQFGEDAASLRSKHDLLKRVLDHNRKDVRVWRAYTGPDIKRLGEQMLERRERDKQRERTAAAAIQAQFDQIKVQLTDQKAFNEKRFTDQIAVREKRFAIQQAHQDRQLDILVRDLADHKAKTALLMAEREIRREENRLWQTELKKQEGKSVLSYSLTSDFSTRVSCRH